MTKSEFIQTNPLAIISEDEIDSEDPTKQKATQQALMSISLHFDPYSATAQDDYEKLKEEVGRFPILDIIKSELSKSRVNISLARRLISVLQYINEDDLQDACKSLVENEDLLYPVYFNVLTSIRAIFDRLNENTRSHILNYVRGLLDSGAPVFAVELNVQYAVRLLAYVRTEESAAALIKLYENSSSEPIRRDIILIMANWKEWGWLSDQKNHFGTMRSAERRAFVIASYKLKDEGKHWRQHSKDGFSPMELIARDWAAERAQDANWVVPL